MKNLKIRATTIALIMYQKCLVKSLVYLPYGDVLTFSAQDLYNSPRFWA